MLGEDFIRGLRYREVDWESRNVKVRGSPACPIPPIKVIGEIMTDYPDVQLRGDHVGDWSLLSLPKQSSIFQGHLLQPQYLDETLGPVEPGLRAESMQPLHDEGYLVMDGSISLNREPLSNSMLNSYLESKLIEVYRQHMQDSLARCSSPLSLTPPQGLVPPAAQHLSQHLCQDYGVDSSTAYSIAVHYLSTCTVTSSHFSSPDLRISQPDQRI
ncbi:TLR adapter interacting with SLC15A4 on the lysosome isoform X2 [Hypomesus transpacificus]|uniref:TLR adapter interacting with SLC15A4 on the lysosome isoform X2 n=1 Tax=Hypomesus transpacificus TaxID=137520 RepID=UPI001F0856EA|nr:TLR adapter interacting with SLC15A4 on the lysosome isoform X2 [Hypomesus transpacificus]